MERQNPQERPSPEHRPSRVERPEPQRRERMTYEARRTRGRLHVTIPEHEKGKFRYFWAVDRPGRIAELEEQWYERVDIQVAGGTVRHAGAANDGSGEKAVLMRIPIEYYEEDMEQARQHREATMRQISEHPLSKEAASKEGLHQIDASHGYIDVDASKFVQGHG